MTEKLETGALVERLCQAKHVAVSTGAGISAESGIPTFRGKEGLWKKYRAEELATPTAFAQNPELVWEFYEWRRGIISEKEPNPGHEVLARWENVFPIFSLITQFHLILKEWIIQRLIELALYTFFLIHLNLLE